MNCPMCGNEKRVVVGTFEKNADNNLRLVACTKCKHQWVTVEIDYDMYNSLAFGNADKVRSHGVLEEEIESVGRPKHFFSEKDLFNKV